VTIANIKDERFSRNPVIVQVLSDLGYIERLGYGVDRVIDVMRERNLREPQFLETGGGFRATLYKTGQTASAEGSVPVLTGLFRDQPVNPRQEAALQFLLSGHSRITNSDLAAIFPEVHAETIRRDLADLVSKNILRKLGEKRGSYYILRAD
jgi:ATP-dependent DNA helicase RecG